MGELFNPASVLLGAVIAAWVSWWNSRTSPFGRLETLLRLYRDWPEELDGRDTIEVSIATTLTKIRGTDAAPWWRRRIAIIVLFLLIAATLIALVLTETVPPQPAGAIAFFLIGIIVVMASVERTAR